MRARALLLAGAALALGLLLAAPLAAYVKPELAGADEARIVLSGSMEPAIGVGDVVLVAETPIEAVEPGDVVTFRAHEGADTTYTHRVVEVVHDERGTVLTTKGDANDEPDPMAVNDAMLVGTVEHTVPHLGTVVAAAQSELVFLALVVLSVLTVGFEVNNLLAARGAEGRRFPVVEEPARFQVVRRR